MPDEIPESKTANHAELLAAIKHYLAKTQAFANDGCPANYLNYVDADKQLSRAMAVSQKELA